MSDKKFAIFGSTGFIGSHFLKFLLRQDLPQGNITTLTRKPSVQSTVHNVVGDYFLSNGEFEKEKIQKIINQETNEQTRKSIIEMSYAFSKALGEKIIEKANSSNMFCLQISDVYGPGQDISRRIVITPHIAARRLQRFLAAYLMIKKGETDWIPNYPENLHGFSKEEGRIFHFVWNDTVFPTYIGDVCQMMFSARLLESKSPLLPVFGPKLNNEEMMEAIQSSLDIKLSIKSEGEFKNVERKTSGFSRINMNQDQLLPLTEGLKVWLRSSS